jgi:hypothetical protein
MCGAIPPPLYVFMAWCLVKHKENYIPFPHFLRTWLNIYENKIIFYECRRILSYNLFSCRERERERETLGFSGMKLQVVILCVIIPCRDLLTFRGAVLPPSPGSLPTDDEDNMAV